jgi:hypothetical protein
MARISLLSLFPVAVTAAVGPDSDRAGPNCDGHGAAGHGGTTVMGGGPTCDLAPKLLGGHGDIRLVGHGDIRRLGFSRSPGPGGSDSEAGTRKPAIADVNFFLNCVIVLMPKFEVTVELEAFEFVA